MCKAVLDNIGKKKMENRTHAVKNVKRLQPAG